MDRLELEDRRARNLIWTGAGRCDFTPDFLAYGGDGRALPYWNILLGAARRFYDYPKLEGFFADIETKGNSTFLVDMVWLGLENALFEKSRLIWPNLPSMRLAYAEGLIQDLDATALVDYYEIVRVAYFERVLNRPAKIYGLQLKFLEDLIITPDLNTDEVIAQFKATFQKYLYRRIKSGSVIVNGRRIWHINGDSRLGRVFSRYLTGSGLARATGSTAPGKGGLTVGSRFIKSLRKSSRTSREKLEEKFGRSRLTDEELSALEKTVCRGNHRNIRLHVTGQDISTEGKTQHLKNLTFFQSHHIRNHNILDRLKRSIAEIMLTDVENEVLPGISGAVVPGLCYKPALTGDIRIFNQNSHLPAPDFSLDLFLDASASQMNRQEKIAEACFLIAEAFRLNHVPLRVSTYKSVFDTLVVNVLKDYTEDDCTGIFRFYASGYNRDGIAVAAQTNLMEKAGKITRYLMMVSDGQPRDIIGIPSRSFFGLTRAYEGKYSVLDTAEQVIAAKASGIKVIGLFTGLESSWENQQTIYGKSVIRITSVETMAYSIIRALKNSLQFNY